VKMIDFANYENSSTEGPTPPNNPKLHAVSISAVIYNV